MANKMMTSLNSRYRIPLAVDRRSLRTTGSGLDPTLHERLLSSTDSTGHSLVFVTGSSTRTPSRSQPRLSRAGLGNKVCSSHSFYGGGTNFKPPMGFDTTTAASHRIVNRRSVIRFPCNLPLALSLVVVDQC
jgi:hypothetical protein